MDGFVEGLGKLCKRDIYGVDFAAVSEFRRIFGKVFVSLSRIVFFASSMLCALFGGRGSV